MKKEEIISFLEKIKPFINLNSLCKAYNSINVDKIDYNNLRMIINRKSCNRISEDKLNKLYFFIYNHILNDIFQVQKIGRRYYEDKINTIIDKTCVELKKEISLELHKNDR